MYDTWFDSDGNEFDLSQVFENIDSYIAQGGTVYVGTDSMLFSRNCVYATTICIHNSNLKIAKYYFMKQKDKTGQSKNLKHKITKEVSHSIDVALLVLEAFPESSIEIHADVGTSKRSVTRKFVEFIRGWILGSGFSYKVKPNSWASSSIADWHTK